MITTRRRGFFRYSLDELIAVYDQAHGRRSFRLTDLATLPGDQVGRLVPVIKDVSEVRADRGYIVVECAGGAADILFRRGSIEEDVWARIDGEYTLRQIADTLAIAWNQPVDVAFNTTRKVFLQLVRHRICLPRNPIES